MSLDATDTLATLRAQVAVAESSLHASEATVRALGNPTQVWSSETMLTLSFGLLLFGIVVLLLITWTLRLGKGAHQVLLSFGVPLIIVAAVFLVIAGYTERQIAPVIGLLGTLAGYLLGRGNTVPSTELERGARKPPPQAGGAAPPAGGG